VSETILSSFFGYINLSGEEEKKKIFCKINISFRGSNLWILACAIVVASIGLNVNSTAVIIGNANITFNGPDQAGFGLGVYDFDLLKDP
jgi:uncharacterized membrane protein